jgi:Transglutaminase-like superfamily
VSGPFIGRPGWLRPLALLAVIAGCLDGQDSRSRPESRELAALAGHRFVGLYSGDVKIGSGALERKGSADASAIIVAVNAATNLEVAPGRMIASYSRVLEFDLKPPRPIRSAVETIGTPQSVTQSTRIERRSLAIDGAAAKWQRTVSRRGSDGKMTQLEDETWSTPVPKYTLDDELRAQTWVKAGAAAGATLQVQRLDLLARKLVTVRLQLVKRVTNRSPGLGESRGVICLERDDAGGRETFVAFRPDGWPCFLALASDLTARAEPDGTAQSPIGPDGHMAGPIVVDPPLVSPAGTEKLNLRVGGSLAAIIEEAAPGQVLEKGVGAEPGRLRLDVKARAEPVSAAERRKWVEATAEMPSLDREIVSFAKEAIASAPTASGRDRVVALLASVREAVSDDPVPDGVTAAQVLAHRRGGPRGRSLLFVAAARALKMPARQMRGLSYLSGGTGALRSYLPHWWAEVEIDGVWVAVDPTAGEIPANVSHILCGPLPEASIPPQAGAVLTIRMEH